MSLKNPVTPPGIDPGTVRLVAQRLNHYATPGLCFNVVKVIPQQAEVAQRVPGRLRPRVFLTFGTTMVLVRQPDPPAAFTPGEIPGTHI
jgi:hypothetical protein